ncbi:MAG: biopolymer transporter ExbD [Bdellovibrionales bacterium]|nr:biopolymer transporter ExbD [Bdellovibrionales bacterium]
MSASGSRYELNLTPYIDLMSTLIVFLLMTAVWNQISVLSAETSPSTENLNPSTQKPVHLSVTITKKYLELNENNFIKKIAHLPNGIDRATLAQNLIQWKKKYPQKTDVTLNSENSTTYKMMIHTFDELVGQKFPDVGVSTR